MVLPTSTNRRYDHLLNQNLSYFTHREAEQNSKAPKVTGPGLKGFGGGVVVVCNAGCANVSV